MSKYLTEAEAWQRFKSAVKEAGGPMGFAAKHNPKHKFTYQAVQNALRRKRLTAKMIKAMRFKIMYMEED